MANRLAWAWVLILALVWCFACGLDVDPGAAVTTPWSGPSAAYPLGSDHLGRDLLLRLVEGTQTFVGPGLCAALTAAVLGVPLGALVGYWPDAPASSWVRAALTLVASWPRLVLVVVCVSIFTATASDPAAFAAARLYVLALLTGVTAVPQVAEAVAERVARFHREEFVEAARAHGVPERSILVRHILWANCRALIARQATLCGAGFLVIETSLSYLGDYGAPPPRPSWGNVLAGARSRVVHLRAIAFDRWDEGLPAVVESTIRDGAILALLAPSLLIAGTFGALLGVARSLAEDEP